MSAAEPLLAVTFAIDIIPVLFMMTLLSPAWAKHEYTSIIIVMTNKTDLILLRVCCVNPFINEPPAHDLRSLV
jgi:hypothetical protein